MSNNPNSEVIQSEVVAVVEKIEEKANEIEQKLLAVLFVLEN